MPTIKVLVIITFFVSNPEKASTSKPEIKRALSVSLNLVCFMLNKTPPKDLIFKYHSEISRTFSFIHQIEKHYYLAHYQEAYEAANNVKLKAILGNLFNMLFIYYHALVLAQLIRTAKTHLEKTNYQRLVLQPLKKFKKIIKINPINFLRHYYLMKSEYLAIKDKSTKAAHYYEKAIARAKERHHLLDTSLAYELAARFYRHTHKPNLAKYYLRNAYTHYQAFGFKKKIKQLETQHSDQLSDATIRSKDCTTTSLRGSHSIISCHRFLQHA